MSVSVCMIVRNEEVRLAKAIRSTEGLADEVIVVDTGSTDGTIELAKSLGAVVFTGSDRMHKAKSRNQAIRSAKGDWVVILDADEQIADPVGLRNHLEKSQATTVYIKMAFMNDANQPTLTYQQMRCWRRGAYLYKYRCHEIPVPTDGWGKIEHTDFVWEHRPPKDATWKSQYSLDRLLLDVAENPNDARPQYYLGRQYYYRGEWEASIKHLLNYLDSPGVDKADAWYFLSQCYGKLSRPQEQIEALHKACAAQPLRRDWWGTLAELYYANEQYELATGLLKCALELPRQSKSYTYLKWYGSHTYDLLARCLWKLKRYKEGYGHAKRATKMEPDNERLAKNFNFFVDVVDSKVESPTRAPIRHADQKVLFLMRRDYANVGYRMMQAINQLDGWCAHAVVSAAEYFQYPKDIFMPSQEEIEELCNWADVIHIFDSWPRDVTKYGKPLFVSYSGKYYRDNHAMLADDDASNGIVQLCTTIDLTRYGATWIPVPMSANVTVPWYRFNTNFVVAHAPTRRDVKGTSFVEQLRDIQGTELDLIEGVPNKECLERMASANLYVDQFKLGYGVAALEAWALGVPVVASAADDIIAMMLNHIGYLPFVCCKPDGLADLVCLLRDDTIECNRVRKLGMDYVRKFHDPAKVAHQLVELYDV